MGAAVPTAGTVPQKSIADLRTIKEVCCGKVKLVKSVKQGQDQQGRNVHNFSEAQTRTKAKDMSDVSLGLRRLQVRLLAVVSHTVLIQ